MRNTRRLKARLAGIVVLGCVVAYLAATRLLGSLVGLVLGMAEHRPLALSTGLALLSFPALAWWGLGRVQMRAVDSKVIAAARAGAVVYLIIEVAYVTLLDVSVVRAHRNFIAILLEGAQDPFPYRGILLGLGTFAGLVPLRVLGVSAPRALLASFVGQALVFVLEDLTRRKGSASRLPSFPPFDDELAASVVLGVTLTLLVATARLTKARLMGMVALTVTAVLLLALAVLLLLVFSDDSLDQSTFDLVVAYCMALLAWIILPAVAA